MRWKHLALVSKNKGLKNSFQHTYYERQKKLPVQKLLIIHWMLCPKFVLCQLACFGCTRSPLTLPPFPMFLGPSPPWWLKKEKQELIDWLSKRKRGKRKRVKLKIITKWQILSHPYHHVGHYTSQFSRPSFQHSDHENICTWNPWRTDHAERIHTQ